MLKRLYISNFALIGEMDVVFPGKLTVITGETGAGKSIFLEALGLALGNRADLTALKNKTKKCVIEAEFETKELELKAFFTEQDLDYEETLVLRREISAEGKSRSFLNDSLVNLNVLKLLAEKLIDIHSQHQTLLLNQSNFELELLDSFAGCISKHKEYKKSFLELNKLKEKLVQLKEQEIKAKKELDYYEFLFKELEEADLKAGQLNALEEESLRLENAEAIKSNLQVAVNAINGGETNLLTGLSKIKQVMNGMGKFGKNYTALYERINSIYIELKDLADEIEDAENNVAFDEKKLQEINSKMDKLNRLLNKHHVKTEEELLQVKDTTEAKLAGYNSLENEIVNLTNQINTLTRNCMQMADELSGARLKAIGGVEKQVKKMLGDLSMQNAEFKIELSQSPELNMNGLDLVKFQFSANKGVALSELHKVASGGELSRLMLSLKSLLATRKKLPAIIFDEIDSGVSGEVADKIGNVLDNMGHSMQVVVITHLPQMASKGNHHLFVYKKDQEDKTVSYIRELRGEERINEIAKMLSAGKPSQSAKVNAMELLKMN